MLLFALSDAAQATIAGIALWFVVFPALVTALIVYALVQVRNEHLQNQEDRRFRR